MTTENQKVFTLNQNHNHNLKTTRNVEKKAPLKTLSLKPTRSLKKSIGIKPLALKLK
jgi:hypothetical protein